MKTLIELSDMRLEEWDKSIIFGANGVGKTRFCNDLCKKLKEEKTNLHVEILNSGNILELVSLERKDVYVGKASKNKKENAILKSKLDKIKYLDKYFEVYGVRNATELQKKSMTFGVKKITNPRLTSFLENQLVKIESDNKGLITFEEAVELDKSFSKEEYDFIYSLNNNKNGKQMAEELVKKEGTKIITSYESGILNFLKDKIINENMTICPLCGFDYKETIILQEKVKKCLSDFRVDAAADFVNRVNSIFATMLKKQTLLKKYNIFIKENIKLEEQILEITKIYFLLLEVQNRIIEDVVLNVKKDKKQFEGAEKYVDNLEYIISEEKRIASDVDYYKKILSNFKKLVNLPANLRMYESNGILRIEDTYKKVNLNIVGTLSESEVKRLALAVVEAQIIYTNIDYVILDDPIDSYDDYFLDAASLYIADMINNNDISWTITTHLYRPIYLMNKELRKEYENIFYLMDPSFKYTGSNSKPNLTIHRNIPKKDVEKINKSELILLKESVEKKKNFDTDPILILLAGTLTIRNLISEIIPIYRISFKRSKIEKRKKDLENRFLHYSSFYEYGMSELVELYKKIHVNFNEKFIQQNYMTKTANKERETILLKEYNKIYSKNELLKEIYYKMVRVSFCKYNLEKLIYNKMVSVSYSNDFVEQYFFTPTLGKKIELIEKREQKEKTEYFKSIFTIYYEYRIIINDISHGTVRMIPPYLSMNIFDVAKMEYFIKREEGKLSE